MVKNLKTLREDRQLSQQKLGEQIGVTQQAIYKYENDLADLIVPLFRNFCGLSHRKFRQSQKIRAAESMRSESIGAVAYRHLSEDAAICASDH